MPLLKHSCARWHRYGRASPPQLSSGCHSADLLHGTGVWPFDCWHERLRPYGHLCYCRQKIGTLSSASLAQRLFERCSSKDTENRVVGALMLLCTSEQTDFRTSMSPDIYWQSRAEVLSLDCTSFEVQTCRSVTQAIILYLPPDYQVSCTGFWRYPDRWIDVRPGSWTSLRVGRR